MGRRSGRDRVGGDDDELVTAIGPPSAHEAARRRGGGGLDADADADADPPTLRVSFPVDDDAAPVPVVRTIASEEPLTCNDDSELADEDTIGIPEDVAKRALARVLPDEMTDPSALFPTDPGKMVRRPAPDATARAVDASLVARAVAELSDEPVRPTSLVAEPDQTAGGPLTATTTPPPDRGAVTATYAGGDALARQLAASDPAARASKRHDSLLARIGTRVSEERAPRPAAPRAAPQDVRRAPRASNSRWTWGAAIALCFAAVIVVLLAMIYTNAG